MLDRFTAGSQAREIRTLDHFRPGIIKLIIKLSFIFNGGGISESRWKIIPEKRKKISQKRHTSKKLESVDNFEGGQNRIS